MVLLHFYAENNENNLNIFNIILFKFYAENNENNNIIALRVGFVKQNISFAEETMEQDGDGRG